MCTQKSPICTQKSPICTQKSPICTQKSPICTQKSPIFTPKSLIFRETARTHDSQSHDVKHTWLRIAQKSPISPQKSPMSPQKCSRATVNHTMCPVFFKNAQCSRKVIHAFSQKSSIFPPKIPIFAQNSSILPQKTLTRKGNRDYRMCPVFPQASPGLASKQPYFPTKEPYSPAKDPCIRVKTLICCCKRPSHTRVRARQ